MKQDESKPKTASVQKPVAKPEAGGRRRRRAAGSAQGSKTAATVEARMSSGSRVSSTDTASDTPKQKETEVTMLGVGVSADQIKRG